jgi:hypothetical protein
MLDHLIVKAVKIFVLSELSGLGIFIFTSQQNTFIITFSKMQFLYCKTKMLCNYVINIKFHLF